jgi:hypothetical protein
MSEPSADPLLFAMTMTPIFLVGLLVFAPFVYALVMTTRGGQPFQIGRFVLHVIIGGLLAAALSAAGLFAWLWPLLEDLGGLHN